MLKSVLATVVFAAVAHTASAVEFVNVDSSKFTELCIVAVQNGETVKGRDANVQCNGMPINDFVAKYNNAKEETATVIAFENVDNAPESELCIAAATSNEAFVAAKDRLNISKNNIKCNGVDLPKFAKRFNKEFQS